jgi:tetrahydromethanopterin S-methyltransferase subunit G
MQDKINLNKVTERIDKVEQKAIELGFSKVVDKNGRRIGIGLLMPNVTDVVRQTLGEEVTYRILSAMAHAHPWALQQLSFRRVASEDTIFTEIGDQSFVVRAFEKNLEPISVIYLIHKSFVCFAKPVWDKFELFGWDQEHLQDILENASNVLHVNEGRRFWRKNI